jgi:NTP pyrophosphatase (non-canonical NTP hydrolase)
MQTMQLLQLIDQLHDQFALQWIDPEKELLYRHLKLTEEVGELSNDIMSYLWHQRKEKLDEFELDNLGHEVVDVILAALLVGKMTWVDLQQAFDYKINKVKTRFNLQ